jgi:hypothetical protein
MLQLRTPKPPRNQACVRLTFAERRAHLNIVGLAVCNITGTPRLNGSADTHGDVCSELVVVQVRIEVWPNHVEKFERAVASALPRRLALDPPGVVAGEFPIDDCFDLAFVNDDVTYVEVAVCQDVGGVVWEFVYDIL